MKKFLAILLALVMVLSLSVTALAEIADPTGINGNSVSNGEIQVTITEGVNNRIVYSATVDWTDTAMEYQTEGEGTWDPNTHTYENETEEGWKDNTASVTVANHSNAGVTATIAAGNNVTGASYSFDKTSEELDKAVKDSAYDSADKVVFTITADENVAPTAGGIDTFTVTIAAADAVAPTVSMVGIGGDPDMDEDGVIVTVSNVTEEDFPVLADAYWSETPLGEKTKYMGIVFGLDINGDVTVGSRVASYVSDAAYDEAADSLTFTFAAKAARGAGHTLSLVVTDASGNAVNSNVFAVTSPGCFVAGTKVQTVNGPVNIEDIKLGDTVYSIDLATGEKVTNPVTWVQETRFIDATYTIYAGGETIEATYEHPFYVFGKGWVAAEDLTVGDKLMGMDGSEVEITNIVYTDLNGLVQVYNFEVDGTHNYLVGQRGILVHNAIGK